VHRKHEVDLAWYREEANKGRNKRPSKRRELGKPQSTRPKQVSPTITAIIATLVRAVAETANGRIGHAVGGESQHASIWPNSATLGG